MWLLVPSKQFYNNRMKVRELVEFLVFPKSFNVLSFYSKGNYALRIRLTMQRRRDGGCTMGLPVLLEGREARKEEDKHASVNVSQWYYQSEHFFVTFSEEKIIFNTACLFKIQYIRDEPCDTFFDFQIVYANTRRRSTQGGEQPPRTYRVVDSRRLYVNAVSSLNRFKRVLFDDCDYFSYADILFISQSFGQKIRLQDYQLGQFHLFDVRSRQTFHHEAFERSLEWEEGGRGKGLRQAFGLGLEEFYRKMVGEKVTRYRKLCQIYQKFRFFMSAIHNSSTAGTTYFDHLQWVRADAGRQGALMQQYQSQDSDELFMLIYQQSHLLVRNIKSVWQQLLELLLSISFNLMDQLAANEIEESRQTKTKWLLSYSDISHQDSEAKRTRFVEKREEILKRLDIYQDNDLHHPLLIIQNYVTLDQTPNRTQIDSLVVLVHGYQGSSVDLQKARNFMNLYNPYCHGLLIKGIEDDIDNSIEELGKAVAQQIKQHIHSSLNLYRKINFIGYSLGGIIARQSLKHLQQYQQRMNVFISFASPHAGICDASNPLVRTGIWFLTNFDKNKNLKQLNCEPNEDSAVVTLARLSSCDSISWFKRFVAVSSRDDDFVPYESSRLEEGGLGDVTRQMCLNLKQKIKRLERVDVWFDTKHMPGTLDKMIGRRAHIQFLENRLFLDSFFAAYAPLM